MHWARRSTVEKPTDGWSAAGARRSADVRSGAVAVNVFVEELRVVGFVGFAIARVWGVKVFGFRRG